MLSLSGGCGLLPTVLPGARRGDPAPAIDSTARLVGDVTAVDPQTGLPKNVSGILSGSYTGTYEEEILDVYFNDAGAPIAALSRSRLTLDTPQAGTVTSLNLIVVTEMLVMTDEQGSPVLGPDGNPVVMGLRSAATGEIIHGDGDYLGAQGTVHADSMLLFATGQAGLGSLDAELEVQIDPSISPR
jgi:hypothetical protein